MLKSTLRKAFYTAVVVFCSMSFYSCQEDIESISPTTENALKKDDVVNVNGRLVFKDSKSFIKVLTHLENRDLDFINSWEGNQNFLSVRSYNDQNPDDARLEDFNLPINYATIINKDGEYQIGDTIMWLNDGFKHFVPKNDEELLSKIKRDPSINVENRYEEKGKRIGVKTAVSDVATEDLTPFQVDAKYQHEFLLSGNSNSKRKYFFEIYYYSIRGVYGGTGDYAQLITKIKTYYWGSCGWGSSCWKIAGDTVDKRISNLSWQVGYYSEAGVQIWQSGSNLNFYQRDGNSLEPTLWSGAVLNSKPDLKVFVRGEYTASVPSHWGTYYTVPDAQWIY